MSSEQTVTNDTESLGCKGWGNLAIIGGMIVFLIGFSAGAYLGKQEGIEAERKLNADIQRDAISGMSRAGFCGPETLGELVQQCLAKKRTRSY